MLSRVSSSLLVLVAILGCVSAIEFSAYNGIAEPFAAYGRIDVTHSQTVVNFNNTKHLYYVANNIPAQRNEILYQFTCLFTVNPLVSGVPTMLLHVVRPSGENGFEFVSTNKLEGIVSGEPIDLAHLQIEMQIGDMIVVSSPDDSIFFRVGANNIGYPVPYGVAEVATTSVAAVSALSPRFWTEYALSTPPSGVTLPANQFLQLCSSYGTYATRSNVIEPNLMLWVPRDIVRVGDGGKVIKEFKVAIEDDGGYNYTGSDVTVEIVVAKLVTITYIKQGDVVPTTESVWQYDSTRTRAFSGVSHNQVVVIPDFDFVEVQVGEMVGFRVVSPSANGNIVRAVWTHDLVNPQDSYLVFPNTIVTSGPTAGAPVPTLLIKHQTRDTPNFVFKLGAKSPSNIRGDPQFAGFHGQSYQFHGLADEMFNLISTPSMQLNSHFVYLSSGKCGYNNTVCFQHPGTYVDALGFTIQAAQGEIQVKMVAGSHDKGLRVWMGAVGTDLHEVRLGAHPTGLRWSMENSTTSVAELRYTVFGEATIRTPLFDIRVVNSDYFFNLEISMLDQRALRIGAPKHTITDRTICHQDANGQAPVDTQIHQVHRHGAVEAALMKKYKSDFPMHGLIGQTWRNVMVCGKHWMGAVNDYLVSSLFATDYYFNYYTKRA